MTTSRLKRFWPDVRVPLCSFFLYFEIISSHTIVRICPPQNATLEDIFENKDRIDNVLHSFSGISIFSVEMVNPYSRHRQLLLGGGAGVPTTVLGDEEGEKMVEIVPESSNFDESIIPDEKEDVEVIINNSQFNEKIESDWKKE